MHHRPKPTHHAALLACRPPPCRLAAAVAVATADASAKVAIVAVAVAAVLHLLLLLLRIAADHPGVLADRRCRRR